MTTAEGRRVKITRDITYTPPEKHPGWYRRFKKGWEGIVPLAQYEFLAAKGACEPALGDSPEAADSGADQAGAAG